MSDIKSALLGENFSTASNKLKKSIMFDLIKRLELDNCYRCTLKIERIEELSVEHLEAWQRAENPVEAFYSLENIGFSHLNCNRQAAIPSAKKYKDKTEYSQAKWARHYAKNKEEVLRKKRERYHRNKLT